MSDEMRPVFTMVEPRTAAEAAAEGGAFWPFAGLPIRGDLAIRVVFRAEQARRATGLRGIGVVPNWLNSIGRLIGQSGCPIDENRLTKNQLGKGRPIGFFRGVGDIPAMGHFRVPAMELRALVHNLNQRLKLQVVLATTARSSRYWNFGREILFRHE
jgi:hypothetical protein